MKNILIAFLFITSFSTYAQQSTNAIKKAKLNVLNNEKFPYNIDQVKEGQNESALESIYKEFVVKGSITIVRISWYKTQTNPNPMANSFRVRNYYYLKKENGGYIQFYLYQGNQESMQQISRANLISVLGDDYKNQINQLKKVKLSAVKKLVKAYNESHSI